MIGRTGLALALGLISCLLAVAPTAHGASPLAAPAEMARWRAQAARTIIIRDDWGIAHVHGRSDADAVFAMVYAQAEDDFNRIELNYLTALGRQAEAFGEQAVTADLRQRLWVDPADLRRRFQESPPWLRRLMVAWADGLNFYLAVHPDVRPLALSRFEPWMALSFTEGSIGGDIERVSLPELKAFYGGPGAEAPMASSPGDGEPRGSNGIAIAPSNTVSGHALLLINPHTSFFFRSELEATSEEGLFVYGAATWGQFFIYQGFNPHLGWMHTTSGADTVDAFAEQVRRQADRFVYKYGNDWLPLAERTVELKVRQPGGRLGSRRFRIFVSRHGPIVRREGDRWIAEALMYRPVEALEQSFLRTKATSLAAYRKVLELQANSTNNTIYADADGHIAYLHPQFIPRRDDAFDYRRPVDGSDPRTAWRGVHSLQEIPAVIDPKSGYVMNTNNWPWTAAGPDSPKAADFPRYMDVKGENPRGVHAVELLRGRTDFSLEALRAAAFDPRLPAFDPLLAALSKDYAGLEPSSPLKTSLKSAVDTLEGWDRRWSAGSTATSLAVFWGEALWRRVGRSAEANGLDPWAAMASAPESDRLQALAAAQDQLTAEFGGVAIPWGEINRFQRLTDAVSPQFHDDAPSLPVPFVSSRWGSLASFGAKPYPGTRRWYGTSGNSFVAVVEFGPKLRAIAVTAGGESGHPASPHFNDEAARYASGDLRAIYFYPEDLKGHIERTYRPGG